MNWEGKMYWENERHSFYKTYTTITMGIGYLAFLLCAVWIFVIFYKVIAPQQWQGINFGDMILTTVENGILGWICIKGGKHIKEKTDDFRHWSGMSSGFHLIGYVVMLPGFILCLCFIIPIIILLMYKE
jgi:hypothetical protein